MGTSGKLARPDRETMLRLTATMNDGQIATLLNCSRTAVGKWREYYNIPRSQATAAQWNTDRNFFSRIDTPDKAYILGFILADGHVAENGVDISIKTDDAQHLRRIADIMGCDAPLREATNSYDGSKRARIKLCGKQLVRDLNAMGLYHNKSHTATYPHLAPHLEHHLVRGLWDGDGHIGKNQFELIGTDAVLAGVAEAIEHHVGCKLRRRMGGKNNAYHYLYGTRRDMDALVWMYEGSNLALERKRARFIQFWFQAPRT